MKKSQRILSKTRYPALILSLFLLSVRLAHSGITFIGGSNSGSGAWPPTGTPAGFLDGTDDTGASGANAVVSPTMTVINATDGHSFQIAGSTIVAFKPSGLIGIGTTEPSSLVDVFNGSITVRGTNAGLRVVSTGTGTGLQLDLLGVPGGAAQVEIGGFTTSKLAGPPATHMVIKDSTTDNQLGYGLWEIWEHNLGHNDPLVWIHNDGAQSNPAIRIDDYAPDIEIINKSTDNALGLGKMEIAIANQGVKLQINGRAYDNTSFETIAQFVPLSKGGGVEVYPSILGTLGNLSASQGGGITLISSTGVKGFTLFPGRSMTASFSQTWPDTSDNAQNVIFQSENAPDRPLKYTTGTAPGYLQRDGTSVFFGPIPAGGAADNLGNGIATTDINANGFKLLNVASFSWVGTGTSTGGIIAGPSTFTAINMPGPGAAVIASPNGEVDVQQAKFYSASMTAIIESTVTRRTGGVWIVATASQATSVQYSTMPQNGLHWADGVNSGSTTANAGWYKVRVPGTYVFGSTPVLVGLTAYSSGTVTQQQAWLISFATASSQVSAPNAVHTSTVVATLAPEATPAGGGYGTSNNRYPLLGVCNLLRNIGPAGAELFVRAPRDGDNSSTDPAQSNSALEDLIFEFLVKR